MPKRSNSVTDVEILHKRLKKLEEELLRDRKIMRHRPRRRIQVISSSSSGSESETQGSPSRQPDKQSGSPTHHAETHVEDVASSSRDNVIQSLEKDQQDLQISTFSAEDGGLSMEDGLDEETLRILGIDPTKLIKYGVNIQKDVAVRFEHISTNGLTKDDRKQLTEKYLIPENCKLVGVPTLNPEIKAAVTDMVLKRDKSIAARQHILAAAISSVGASITYVLSSKDKDNDLLKLLMDTGRLLCDCQHTESLSRRNAISYAVKKEMKESLNTTSIDEMLFGNNLFDTLKTAKAINKTGADLKIPVFKASTSKQNTTSKNWKPANSTKKPPPMKPSSTAAMQNKNQHVSSFKQSFNQRTARRQPPPPPPSRRH